VVQCQDVHVDWVFAALPAVPAVFERIPTDWSATPILFAYWCLDLRQWLARPTASTLGERVYPRTS